jgi:hypothetical protein
MVAHQASRVLSLSRECGAEVVVAADRREVGRRRRVGGVIALGASEQAANATRATRAMHRPAIRRAGVANDRDDGIRVPPCTA